VSTRELRWERGYAATSPRAILDRAGAGQGSMYHHFAGKAYCVRETGVDGARVNEYAPFSGTGDTAAPGPDDVARYTVLHVSQPGWG
jgi:TetR/AcrR family transcriptional repressor of nem operon